MHIGTLDGRGTLRWSGGEQEVIYRIDAHRPRGGLLSGQGSLEADTLLFGAFNAEGDTVLELEDGGTVTVVINHVDMDGARFLTSGPIPGF